jgi:hypothetical protein
MKRILLATTLLAGCTDNADVGISSQPVQCKSTAQGFVHGTVSNPATHQSYTFGSPQASLAAGNNGPSVSLSDSSLSLGLQFICGQPATGTYDAAGGQPGCPQSVLGTVSGNQQQVYGLADAGEVIVDQNVGCIAGRYDMHFVVQNQTSVVDVGELVGWFSVPLP